MRRLIGKPKWNKEGIRMKFYTNQFTGEILMETEVKKRYGETVVKGFTDPAVTSYAVFRDRSYKPVEESSLTEYKITMITQSKYYTTIKAPSFTAAKEIVREDFENGELYADTEKIVEILSVNED